MAAFYQIRRLKISPQPSLKIPIKASPFTNVKKYSQTVKEKKDRVVVEDQRAPSLAEEFKKVAEEKVRRAEEKGLSSQTFEKTYEGAEEAIIGDSKAESVKNRFKK